MLKISITEEVDQIVLRVEGKLVSPWTRELEGAWEALTKTMGGRRLCLDVRDATYADQNGLAMLGAIMKSANPHVLADCPLARQFVEQARQTDENQERKQQ